MKTSLLTLALAAITIVHAQAQGTIQFANNVGTRFHLEGVYPANTSAGGPAANTYYFAVFVGQTADSLGATPAGPIGGNTTTGGLITAPNPNAYQLAGTEANSTVYLQIRGWHASFGIDGWARAKGMGDYGETPIKRITLGPTAGPGTVIWGTAPNQFQSLNLRPMPEPSTAGLAVLSGLAVMWLHRRRTTK